jgi:hypothetical protein
VKKERLQIVNTIFIFLNEQLLAVKSETVVDKKREGDWNHNKIYQPEGKRIPVDGSHICKVCLVVLSWVAP